MLMLMLCLRLRLLRLLHGLVVLCLRGTVPHIHLPCLLLLLLLLGAATDGCRIQARVHVSTPTPAHLMAIVDTLLLVHQLLLRRLLVHLPELRAAECGMHVTMTGLLLLLLLDVMLLLLVVVVDEVLRLMILLHHLL